MHEIIAIIVDFRRTKLKIRKIAMQSKKFRRENTTSYSLTGASKKFDFKQVWLSISNRAGDNLAYLRILTRSRRHDSTRSRGDKLNRGRPTFTRDSISSVSREATPSPRVCTITEAPPLNSRRGAKEYLRIRTSAIFSAFRHNWVDRRSTISPQIFRELNRRKLNRKNLRGNASRLPTSTGSSPTSDTQMYLR